MEKMKFLFGRLYWLAFVMMLSFGSVSCSDDNDDNGDNGSNETVTASIASMGLEDGANVNVGETVQLEAQLNGIEGEVIYYWTVNNDEVSTSSTCSFVANEEQSYTVRLVVESGTEILEKKITLNAIPYTGRFYIINEGQSNASVNLYNAGALTTVNNTLPITGTVGQLSGDLLYVVTKGSPQLSLIDLQSGAILEQLTTEGQGSNFRLIDEHTGVLSTTKGLFSINLDNFEIENTLSTGNCKDLFLSDNHLFVLEGSNIKAYNTDDFSLEAEMTHTAVTGFAQTPDGTVWAANQNSLVKIDVPTMESEEIALPEGMSIYYNQWAYTPTGLQASTTENVLYFPQKVEEGFNISGKDIYKYNTENGTATLFFQAPAEDKSVYGAGIQVNPETGDVYLVYTEDGWGEHYLNTHIYIVEAETARQKAIVDYTGEYWFPSTLIFIP